MLEVGGTGVSRKQQTNMFFYFRPNIKWASSWGYGTYRIGNQRMFKRDCADQASLRIRAVSLEPSLFAHMNYGSRRRVRPKIRHLAPLDGCTCVFEEWIYRGQKVPKSHEMAQMVSSFKQWFYSTMWLKSCWEVFHQSYFLITFPSTNNTFVSADFLQAQCRGAAGLAGQIISKSCSFSPETAFTPLILASKSEFS